MYQSLNVSQIPVIDISSLVSDNSVDTIANQIRQACCDTGFFYIIEHGVDRGLQNRLEQLSRQFFAQGLETKMQIRMALGGRAWRGYFPVEGELTNGKPDLKEGIYLGSELTQTHPAVQAGVPMHGANLFPDIPLFRNSYAITIVSAISISFSSTFLLYSSFGAANTSILPRLTHELPVTA